MTDVKNLTPCVQIGISGPSCSGKSTVAEIIARRLEIPLFHLDDRWTKGAIKPIINGHKSYERPSLYDGDGLAKELSGKSRFIAEGFLLFLYAGLLEIPHRFFLDISYEEQLKRRIARAKARNHSHLGDVNDSAEVAWRHNGREEWEAFGERQRHIEGVVCLNGLDEPEELARLILQSVQEVNIQNINE